MTSLSLQNLDLAFKYYQKKQNKTKRAVCTITLSNVRFSTYYDSIARENQNWPRALGKSIL